MFNRPAHSSGKMIRSVASKDAYSPLFACVQAIPAAELEKLQKLQELRLVTCCRRSAVAFNPIQHYSTPCQALICHVCDIAWMILQAVTASMDILEGRLQPVPTSQQASPSDMSLT